MSPLNAGDLHRIFSSLDQNGDGLLSLEELTWLLEKTGVHASYNDLVSLVGEIGLNFDEFSYFYESMLNKEKIISSGSEIGEIEEAWDDEEEVSELFRAFKVFDLNGDGFISPEELQSVLWRLGMCDNRSGLDCDRIMRKYDVNSDGFVDFEEFKSMMLAH